MSMSSVSSMIAFLLVQTVLPFKSNSVIVTSFRGEATEIENWPVLGLGNSWILKSLSISFTSEVSTTILPESVLLPHLLATVNATLYVPGDVASHLMALL